MTDEAEKTKRAVVYCRVSTEEQAKGGVSLGMQKDRLTMLGPALGMVVVDVIIDDGYSAKDLNRPGIQKVLGMIRAKSFDTLLVYKVDRLTRSLNDLCQLEVMMSKNGVEIRSSTENFETGTPIGRMLFNLLGSFAQFERELIAERTRDARERLWQEGRWGMRAPFGYKFDNKMLIPHPIQGPLVRELYERAVTTSVRDLLISIRPDTRYDARKWHLARVHDVLTSRAYLGEVKRGKQWGPGLHEAIITPALYGLVQATLLRRKNVFGPRGPSQNLFSGIALCGTCGAKLVARTGRRKGSKNTPDPKSPHYAYYICARIADGKGCELKPLNKEVLENAVFSSLREIGRDRELLQRIVVEVGEVQDSSITDKRVGTRTCQREIRELEKQKGVLLKNFTDSVLPEAARLSLGQHLADVENQLKSAQTRLYSLEAFIAANREKVVSVDLLASLLQAPETYLPMLDQRERKQVIGAIIPRLVVQSATDITITIALPSGEEISRPWHGGEGFVTCSHWASLVGRGHNILLVIVRVGSGFSGFRMRGRVMGQNEADLRSFVAH